MISAWERSHHVAPSIMFAIVSVSAFGSRTVLDGIATDREASTLAQQLKKDNPRRCYAIVFRP
jgi:hypothetical protein